MRLVAFRIFNFRSILDTGWQTISPDNITCLIGQNESGKTSVLEGLNVFHSGAISEDVLRSDMTLPKVYCKFEINPEILQDRFSDAEKDLQVLLKGADTIILERVWEADLSSKLEVGGEIKVYFEGLLAEKDKYIEELSVLTKASEHDIEILRSKLSTVSTKIENLESSLSEAYGKSGGISLFKKRRKHADPDFDNKRKEIQLGLKESQEEHNSLSKLLEAKAGVIIELTKLSKLREELTVVETRLVEISLRLEERHQTMTLLSGPSMKELSMGEWERVLEDYRSESNRKVELISRIEEQVLICTKVTEDGDLDNATREAKDIIKKHSSNYSAESIVDVFKDNIPVFEIFEDFGSLLPNRIDLEDIVTSNEQVEGYKAAKNFLNIAQLDYSFFQQPSSRILKQKIENLNSRLTLDFQDFWQQYVGRKNKIRISFELDHYSTNHGEKAGKPYLEFWVKDEGERLYPKQRSRGVRWFLSFYLELMAASERNKKHLILLVDEPGVSLHARAQEDVLKVFEDIKDNIQVIYTTHSPHLVDIDKLHRVLAIQRDDVENQRSATTILDPIHLVDASPDTLSPLQSIMGNPVGNQEFSADKFNIIVNDVGTYYLMTAALNLIGYKGRIHFIPSTEPQSIPLMCNILMGWGMNFAVLLFNNEVEIGVSEELKNLAFTDNLVQKEMIVVMPEGFSNAEDLMSTLDFKNHILHSREGITVANSEYITERNLPRNFLLSKFLSTVKSGKLKRDNFDEETRENLALLLSILQKYK